MHRCPEKFFMIDRFLCTAEAKRVLKTLRKFSHHDISRWALAGGLAVEIHCLRAGLASTRALNDIDFVASEFDCIPRTLAGDFLFRHVHPLDPPNKTILQFVDAETALRLDLFRADPAIMTRTLSLEFPFGSIRLISGEDVLARAARLLMDLRRGVPITLKNANDYMRLEKLVQHPHVEAAWQDHRKPNYPQTFRETNMIVHDLIATHRDLLVTPNYSQDATQVCPRCVATESFPLADPHLVLLSLGYC
jgi:hypothetical protein